MQNLQHAKAPYELHDYEADWLSIEVIPQGDVDSDPLTITDIWWDDDSTWNRCYTNINSYWFGGGTFNGKPITRADFIEMLGAKQAHRIEGYAQEHFFENAA